MEGIEAYALPDVPVVVHRSSGLVLAYKVVPAVGAACALAGLFFYWDTKAIVPRLPHTMSATWKVAEMLRFYDCEREAGPSVVLNPFRQSAPPCPLTMDM